MSSWEVLLIRSLGRVSRASCILFLARWKASSKGEQIRGKNKKYEALLKVFIFHICYNF